MVKIEDLRLTYEETSEIAYKVADAQYTKVLGGILEWLDEYGWGDDSGWTLAEMLRKILGEENGKD